MSGSSVKALSSCHLLLLSLSTQQKGKNNTLFRATRLEPMSTEQIENSILIQEALFNKGRTLPFAIDESNIARTEPDVYHCSSIAKCSCY